MKFYSRQHMLALYQQTALNASLTFTPEYSTSNTGAALATSTDLHLSSGRSGAAKFTILLLDEDTTTPFTTFVSFFYLFLYKNYDINRALPPDLQVFSSPKSFHQCKNQGRFSYRRCYKSIDIFLSEFSLSSI